MRRTPRALLLATLAALVGCAGRQVENPSFAVAYDDAVRELAAMGAATTRPTLPRPLLILDGINSLGGDAARIKAMIAATSDGPIVTARFPFPMSLAGCRRDAVAALDRAIGPGDDAGATREVDVVGLSLGGLVARVASVDDAALGRRLRVRRLYTIASPMTGAREAARLGWLSPLPLHRDLRPGSALYARLRDGPGADYPVVSYTRLGDGIVGARYASPPGQGVYWLANRPGEHAHYAALRDPRVVVDIVRRLRGEPPLTSATPSPLPDGVD